MSEWEKNYSQLELFLNRKVVELEQEKTALRAEIAEKDKRIAELEKQLRNFTWYTVRDLRGEQ